MTTNEIIARWLGLQLITRANADTMANAQDQLPWLSYEGRLIIELDGAIVDRFTEEFWCPDTDISLWHGDGGLLAEIRKHGLMAVFVDVLDVVPNIRTLLNDDNAHEIIFAFMECEPPQLAAALVKCIEGET